jgi:hypothetical protein
MPPEQAERCSLPVGSGLGVFVELAGVRVAADLLRGDLYGLFSSRRKPFGAATLPSVNASV